jgi:peptide deformylase
MRSTVFQNIMSMTALLCSIGMSSRGIRPTGILVSAFSPTRISTSRNFITNKGNTFQQPKPHSPSNIIRLHSSMKEEVDPGKVDGTDLRVLKYPAPSLRAENKEITEEELKSGDIKQIAKEMFLVMYATEGVGLAAPQVGINKCLMVYNETGDKKKWMQEVIMVNPKIVEYSEAKDIESEGCLSFPGMNGDVERSKWIKVEAQNIRGKKFKKKFKGWEARIFQHEYDHLDGVLYPDRLTEEGTAEVKPRIDELIAEFGEGGAL